MSNQKKGGLGRGLSSLLAGADKIDSNRPEVSPRGMAEIEIDSIEVNPYQPRTQFDADALAELAESIKVQGIIQPITVRQLESGRYQLISGERRLQASKIAGLQKIPAYVRTANDQQMLEMALIENIQRENLNPLEIALSYQRLISECNLKQEELGDRVGKKRTTVNNYLRLLKLPPQIQAAIKEDKITMGHAKALAGVEKIDQQLALFQRTMKENLSVRQVEELARQLAGEAGTPKTTKPSNDNPHLLSLKSRLTSYFGTKVTLRADKNNKGEIRIPFMSAEDLERILELMHFKS